MGQTTDKMSDLEITDEAVDVSNETTESPEEIRARIEQTRSELGDTLSALQDRLEPERLKEQAKEQIQEQVDAAKESVKEATVGKAGEWIHNVSDTISETVRPVVETVSQTAHSVTGSAKHTGSTVGNTGSSFMDTVRQNPLPAAMAAFGIGWLMLQNGKKSNNHSNDYNAAERRHSWNDPSAWRQPSAWTQPSSNGQTNSPFSKAGDTAGKTVENMQESAGHLTHKAQHKTHEAQDGLQRALQDTPLAVGAVALAVGAAVGLSLPSTAPERQLMGEAKEAVMDKASHAAQDTLGKVKEVAGQVVEEASRTAILSRYSLRANPSRSLLMIKEKAKRSPAALVT
jgi:uncharacterized protein YjbJ (UPF0337 family)